MLRSVFLVVVLAVASHAARGDWPTYGGDAGRSHACDATLPGSLDLHWRRVCPAPAPAWPAPARGSSWQNLDSIEPRVVDDRVDHVVAVGQRAVVASSRADHVLCLDVTTGKVIWRHLGDAPYRFAPAIEGDRVVVGGDDGIVRCLALEDGATVWARRVGPDLPRVAGNGRLISPLPIRTGVLVDEGVVYVCAGLFPTQGVWGAALDLDDGSVVWRRRLTERSPQGYLARAGERIIVPGGRANPFSLERATGEAGPAFGGVGGSYAVIEGDRVVAGRGNDGTLVASDTTSGARIVSFPGHHIAVTATRSIVATADRVMAIDRVRLDELRAERAAAEANDDGAAIVEIDRAIGACTLWSEELVAKTLLVAGDEVVVGTADSVVRLELETGVERQRLSVRGGAASLAVADERLLVMTEMGILHCFAGEDVDDPPVVGVRPAINRVVPNTVGRRVARVTRRLGRPDGYALVLGAEDLDLAAALANIGMRVMVVEYDADVAARFRRDIDALGHAGQVAVVHCSDGTIPVASDLINATLSTGRSTWPMREIDRVTVPGERGIILLGDDVQALPWTRGRGQWTHQYGDIGNTCNSRDRVVSSDLALQWFGGPGPERMIDRHMRGPPPLAMDGRLFIVGENRLIAVDAHNGTELWDLALPQSQRYAMPYDAGYIAARRDRICVATGQHVALINPRTGRLDYQIVLPLEVREGHHWGWMGVTDDAIFGSALLPTAPRTEANRRLADESYRSGVPLVTSRAVFRMGPHANGTDWHRAGGIVINPTLTVAAGRVMFVESRNTASREEASGRVALETLLAEDAWLVALDAATGEIDWEVPVDASIGSNALFLASDGRSVVLIGSRDGANDDAVYAIRVLEPESGEERWRAEHANGKPGQLYHGEQVHHPVLLDEILVAEPYLYEIETGERVEPDGDEGWAIRRPGHSCGTMSGAGSCLFFRANNPTVLDIADGLAPDSRFRVLSPSRVGCWINILPAEGLVLIPEGSASCVCHYALQTSMAFRPRRR